MLFFHRQQGLAPSAPAQRPDRTRPARTLLALGVLAAAVLALSACDSGPPVKTEYRNADALTESLAATEGPILVDLDRADDDLIPMTERIVSDLEGRLSAAHPTALTLGRQTAALPLTLRIVVNPPEGRSAISACQGKRIGRATPRARSLVIVAASCANGRRLIAVRSVMPDIERASEAQIEAFLHDLARRALGLSEEDD